MQFSYSFPLWIAALGLAIAAVIIAFAYRRTDKPLSRRIRVILIALRVASVGLLLICLLEPKFITREDVHRKANLLVLVDDSQSMSLTDVDGQTGTPVSRIDAVKEAFAPDEGGTMSALADKFDLQFYQFSSECVQVEELVPTAEGTLTDIGNAISKTDGEWRGQLTGGIVLVTDGGNNSGDSPVEIIRRINMPVYTVGVGSTQMPRDIQIARVEVSPIAYADHLLPVRAVIKSSGYDGREVQVELKGGDVVAQQTMPLLDSVPLTLDSQNGEQIVNLQLKPQQEGTHNFSITVTAAPDELTDQNNVYPFFVRVVKTKLKVLYIDGRPRWEYTFIKRALQRDPNMEPTCVVAKGAHSRAAPQDDDSNIPRFPTTRNELFAYDVLILGDISPGFFSGEQLNIINDFVDDRGGSIIFLGGKNSLGRGGFGDSVLRGMLPIDIGPDGARQIRGAFNPVLTADGRRHPITRFSNDQVENVAIWRDLPALPQLYEGAGVKLGATILAEYRRDSGAQSFRLPLVVFQRYGEGMVMMIASDSLWRWAFGAYPFGGNDSHYRRFWSGAVRWLSSIHTEADLVNVETDKGSYYRDEKVQVTAYVYDENYAPVSDAQLKAQIQDPGSSVEASLSSASDLDFSSDGDGRYRSEFIPRKDGRYSINVEAHYAGGLLGRSSAEFIVQKTVLEFQDTQLNESLLRNIADISGGSYHHITDVSALNSSIKEVSDTYTSIRERGLWDNALMLIVVVAILATEWLLRKRKGLV